MHTSASAGSSGSTATRRDAWMSTRVAPFGPAADPSTVTGPVRSAVDAPRLAGASRRRSISAASIPRPPSESPLVRHSLGIGADLVTAPGTDYCGGGPDAAKAVAPDGGTTMGDPS